MKKIDLRNLITALVGAVINRSILLMMNPFGVAYFAAAYMYRPGRWLMVLGSILGMASILPVGILIKYIGVITGIVIITKILELRKKIVTPRIMAIISGVLTGIAGFAYSAGLNGIDQIDTWRVLLISSLEGVAVFAMVFVLNHTIRIILYHKNDQIMTNEEQISLGLSMALSLFAFRGLLTMTPSVIEAVILFVLLYIGYCFGAGAGAIAGACIGGVLAYQQSDMSLLGFMALLGILAGAFREKGRLPSGVIYMGGVLLVGYLGVPYLLDVSVLRGMIGAVLVFLLLPDRLAVVKRRQVPAEGDEVGESLEKTTMERLLAFADSFKKLSSTFNTGVRPRIELSQDEVNEAFDELTQNICGNCIRCDYCWEKEYYDTYHATSNILDFFSKNGEMERGQLPIGFKRRCINIEGFLNETSRIMEVAKLNLNWQNRMMESRLAIAGQLYEVADIIEDFSEELKEEQIVVKPEADALKQRLALSKVNVKSLTVVEKPNRRKSIFMVAKMRQGRCMTAKEICGVIQEIYGKKFVLAKGCRMVISKEYNTYEFVEDLNYKTIQGVAKAVKHQETVSGDSFTFMPLEGGQMIMSLSDGMGTGKYASEDSEYIIELLEQLLETGFSEKSAVRLINSMMFLKSERQAFSTIDMGILDLYSGMCEFIKIGASTTYIKHKSGVEAIRSSTLPVGAFTQVDYEGISRKIDDGDMVVMVTDGIINHLEEEDKDEQMGRYIGQLDVMNPQDLANSVLEYAMAKSNYRINDDMTVLTCGVYKT